MSVTMRPVRKNEKRAVSLDPRVGKWLYDTIEQRGVSKFFEDYALTEWFKQSFPEHYEAFGKYMPALLASPSLKERLIRALEGRDEFGLGSVLKTASIQRMPR